MFYRINQSNPGGSYRFNNEITTILIIEAASEQAALDKAVELGVYFNGIDQGIDCPCCGDRWYEEADDISDLELRGLPDYKITDEFQQQYNFTVTSRDTHKWYDGRPYTHCAGLFASLEDYAQYVADEFWDATLKSKYEPELGSWPPVRIFYLDGTVKEFFKIG